jgi:nucleotide-binding universal stress UspA family protein
VPTNTRPLDLEGSDRQDEEALDRLLREVLGSRLPSKLTQVVKEGHPVGVLLAQAVDAALLVVGARGRGGFAGLRAESVSEQCVRHAPCSVVVVRPRD